MGWNRISHTMARRGGGRPTATGQIFICLDFIIFNENPTEDEPRRSREEEGQGKEKECIILHEETDGERKNRGMNLQRGISSPRRTRRRKRWRERRRRRDEYIFLPFFSQSLCLSVCRHLSNSSPPSLALWKEIACLPAEFSLRFQLLQKKEGEEGRRV